MARTSVFADNFAWYTNATAANLHSQSADWELNNTGATAFLQVKSQQVVADSLSGARRLVQVSGQTFAADQYASIDLFIQASAGINAGVLLRAQSPSTLESAYKVVLKSEGGAEFAIEKYEAGTSTILASISADTASFPAYSGGVTLTLSAEIEGNEIRCYGNGQLLLSYTDIANTFTSGVPGLFAFDTPDDGLGYFDNFDSGNLGTVTSTAGISAITIEDAGVAVADATVALYVFAGHGVDLDTTAPAYKSLTEALTSGVTGNIDLSSTSIAVNDNITVVGRLPSGKGFVWETTAGDLSA